MASWAEQGEGYGMSVYSELAIQDLAKLIAQPLQGSPDNLHDLEASGPMQALKQLLFTLLPSTCSPLTAVLRLSIKLADLTAEGGSAVRFSMIRNQTLA